MNAPLKEIPRAIRMIGMGAAASALVVATGCDDETKLEQNAFSATVSGTVVDARAANGTGDPIADASVELVVDGEARTTTTDADGRFSFDDVPATGRYDGHELSVNKDGYFAAEADIPIETNSSMVAEQSNNLGEIGLAAEHTLTVNVTNQDGAIDHGAPVVAFPAGTKHQCMGNVYEGSRVVASTSGGSADLTLSECVNYELFVPAHGESDTGPVEYITGEFKNGSGNKVYDPMRSGDTVAINIERASLDQGLRGIAGSWSERLDGIQSWPGVDRGFMTDGPTNKDYNNIRFDNIVQPGDDIRIVFNYPVTLNNDPHLTVERYMTEPDGDGDGAIDSDYGSPEIRDADFNLDETGTILTISPASDLPVNEVISLEGVVTAVQGPEEKRETETDLPSVYVANGDGVATDADNITVDNYASSGTAATPYVEFPDYVEGRAQLISYTQGDTTTVVNGQRGDIGFEDLVWTDGSDGNGVGSGAAWRMSLGGLSLDDGDKVKLQFWLEGPDGAYDFTEEFTVQGAN